MPCHCPLFPLLTGETLGLLPSEEELVGVAVFGSQPTGSSASLAGGSQALSLADAAKTPEDEAKSGPLVPIGAGLPALPNKLVAKIRANEFIDFAELPPAKGKMRSFPQGLEGQVIVVQAEDLLQAKKLIPDLAT